LSSISRIVASAVDFLAGITAAEEGLAAGDSVGLLLALGEEDLVGDGELCGFGVGDEVFSVVTETLGSSDLLFSDGEASGDGLSSCAKAKGTAAAKSAVSARTVIFIRFSYRNFEGSSRAGNA
jgi:hypothetical protein